MKLEEGFVFSIAKKDLPPLELLPEGMLLLRYSETGDRVSYRLVSTQTDLNTVGAAEILQRTVDALNEQIGLLVLDRVAEG